MSFISPLPSTGHCTPVDPTNIIDYSASRTQGHPSLDHQSQWARESHAMPRFFRGHNIDISDVVATAPEILLEKNARYVRLKLIAGERTVEVNDLRESIASQYNELESQRKELEALKIRCDTYRETIDVFAKNCITLKTASGDATPIILMANVPFTADMKKGETDRDSGTAGTKAKPGRQRQDSDDDSMSEYIYLQNADGTTVSKKVISRMSEKAQAIWEALDERGLAPTTFDNISEIAWDFYARIMLNDPEFFFLQLCDDGQWKLKEWSNSSYSSWYGNRGVRQKKAESNDSIPDDTNPVQLGSTNKKIDRNICMRHWNKLQPGGQGLASEFDVYFKTLSDTDKEVSRPLEMYSKYHLEFLKLSTAIQEGNACSPKSNCTFLSYLRYSLDRIVILEEGQNCSEVGRRHTAQVQVAQLKSIGPALLISISMLLLSLLRPLLVSWTLSPVSLSLCMSMDPLKSLSRCLVSSSSLLLSNLGINYSGRSCSFRRFHRTSPDWPTSLCINSMDRSPLKNVQ
ncbi:hypothetical protein EDB89DRAFT_2024193 [Lactarius sanguifluus]|nr:hypothetical protein EDB89DRAFT_2024193 [Lactarius sanguifluus]